MLDHLIWLDMPYTRVVASSFWIDMGKLALYLPCKASLFESLISTRLFQLADWGASLRMPPMQIHNFHISGPDIHDSVSMQTLLSALFVQINALRHRSALGTALIIEGLQSFL